MNDGKICFNCVFRLGFLGCWNTSGGPRMSVRKTFFKWNKKRCEDGDQDFILYRRIYVHPNCVPDGGIRKFIWLVKVREGYGRFGLIFFLFTFLAFRV